MGLLFAGKLSLSSINIQLVTRTIEQSKAISDHHLHLNEGNKRLEPIQINCSSFDDNLDTPDHYADWVFLMVKQHHINDRLVRAIKQWSDKGANILCFQNGIGHVERLSEVIPRNRIYSAITTEAARKDSSFKVCHMGSGITWVGAENVAEDSSDVLNNLVNSLRYAGFNAVLSKNIRCKAWSKLLVNSIINPLTAILKIRNGELIQSSDWLQTMKCLYEEGRRVADAQMIELPEDQWNQIISICESTAMNSSSMLQDILLGNSTEIEWINGSIIKMAHQCQISVPTHQAVYHLIKGMEPSK